MQNIFVSAVKLLKSYYYNLKLVNQYIINIAGLKKILYIIQD